MSDPTTTNKLADVVNKILNGLIENAGASSIEGSLIASNPWLGFPFIKQLFELILSKVLGIIYENAALTATKIIIDAQTELENSVAKNAFANLQVAIESGDQEAILLAGQDLSVAYGNLIHYGGSASP